MGAPAKQWTVAPEAQTQFSTSPCRHVSTDGAKLRSATVRKQNAYRHTVSDPVLEAGPTQKLVHREELGVNLGIKPSNRTEKLSPSTAALLLRNRNGR